MKWTWPVWLDQIWTMAASPMGLTLAAACFFGLILVITLARAEKSLANGALTVITLLAIGVAVAATIRAPGPGANRSAGDNVTPFAAVNVALPALSCIDDLAGDLVETSCEKTLFGSAETTAAAVSYAASMLTRLTASGDVAAVNTAMSPDFFALRRAVEHDRYGLMAYVLAVRDRCTPSDCTAFRSITDSKQLTANMEARSYEGLVARYAPQWNAPPNPMLPAVGQIAGLPPSMPTGKPTNADFPSAASTPPISIMTAEPAAPRKEAPKADAPAGSTAAPPVSRPPPAVAASRAQAPVKKAAAPKPKPPAATSLTTPQAEPETAAPPPSE